MIYLASDHRGYEMKGKIAAWMAERGIEYEDIGPSKLDPNDDYPIYAKAVADKVVTNQNSRGILICGSGEGVAVAANKVNGIRAGTCASPEQATAAVNDEDLNVLALSSDFLTGEQARSIANAFIDAKFSGAERHKRRIEEIETLEGAQNE